MRHAYAASCGGQLLSKTVVLKLDGGLGTGMGLEQVSMLMPRPWSRLPHKYPDPSVACLQ